MSPLRNWQHEKAAQALAAGKSRDEAYTSAGYTHNRGNANRMAERPDIVERVAELRGVKVIDLGRLDLPRIMIELARLECVAADVAKPQTDDPNTIWIEIGIGVAPAQTLRLQVADDRGALTALLQSGRAASAGVDLNRCTPDDCRLIEKVLSGLLADRVMIGGRVGPSMVGRLAALVTEAIGSR